MNNHIESAIEYRDVKRPFDLVIVTFDNSILFKPQGKINWSNELEYFLAIDELSKKYPDIKILAIH